jgi:hypothetical protein
VRKLVVALTAWLASGWASPVAAQNPVASRVRRQPPPGARPWIVVRPSAGADLGVATYTGAFGRDTGVGPTYGVRAGADLHRVLRVHAHWQGASHSVTGGATVAMTSVALEITLAPPIGAASPFLTAGAGWYETFVENPRGPDLDTPAALMIPLAAGVEARLSRRLAVSAELGTRLLFARELDEPEPALTQSMYTSLGARVVF